MPTSQLVLYGLEIPELTNNDGLLNAVRNTVWVAALCANVHGSPMFVRLTRGVHTTEGEGSGQRSSESESE